MKWKQFPLGSLQTNCYCLYHEKHCIIIDPSGDGDFLISWLDKNELKPLAIFLTHAHFDHIGALDDLKRKYEIPVYLHYNEKDWLKDPALNGSLLFLPQPIVCTHSADYLIKGGEKLIIQDFILEIFETPGHSPGSISIYCKSENILVSGDVLFQGSIGRTDLPGGNDQQLMETIRKKILVLPKNTLVLPGHGPITTIEDEMNYNPFLQDL